MGKISFHIILIITITITSFGQTENYFVTKARFSSEGADDFSPVYYRNGVVFCSNRNQKILGSIIPDNNKYFRIFYTDTARRSESRMLEGVVNSNLNNGPATFNQAGDTVYFSRNLVVNGSFRDISSPENKLGLFSAVLRNGRWEDVQELRFNDNAWNVTTPSLSPDGKRLYFASDKPEGYGGSDIYYSEWKNGYWDNPVNLGSTINTTGNEAYPYADSEGGLFFSSDNHPGKGGKDIFFSKEVDTAWIKPVPLAAPVNSAGNDFGFVADEVMGHGYFSSDRDRDIDIYSFRTIYPQFLFCEVQVENRYCYSFKDDASIEIDPLNMEFRWNIGGLVTRGYSTIHCFDGPGKYRVRQDIVDRKTGNVVFNKFLADVDILHDGLPFIIVPGDIRKGNQITLKAEPDAPGYETLSYFWEIGDAAKGRGQEISYSFNEDGFVNVKLLANILDKNTGKKRQVCVSKQVMPGPVNESTKAEADSAFEFGMMDNVRMSNIFSYNTQLPRKPVFVVQILETDKEVSTKDLNIGAQYPVRKLKLGNDNRFSYVIAEEQDFMAAYWAYKEASSFGFRNALIRTYIPSDPGEAELWNFKRTTGTSSADYFVNNGFSISPDAAVNLDKLVLLLKRHPGMNLKIIAHTEKTVNQKADIDLSSRQAESILRYLVESGVDASRLSSAGYGGLRRVAPDFPESEKLKNRRIDFMVTE